MVPDFRAGRYGPGLLAGRVPHCRENRSRTQRHPEGVEIPQERQRRQPQIPVGLLIAIFIAFILAARPPRSSSTGCPPLGRRLGRLVERRWHVWWRFWRRVRRTIRRMGRWLGADSADSGAAEAVGVAAVLAGDDERKRLRAIEKVDCYTGNISDEAKRMTRRTALRVVILLTALPLCGLLRTNRFVGQEEAVKDAVGPGAEPAAAPQRPHPEPGRNRQGLRLARRRHLHGNRRGTRPAPGGEDACRSRSKPPTSRRPPSADSSRSSENYPQLKANEQFNRLMDELVGHREPHCGRAHAL